MEPTNVFAVRVADLWWEAMVVVYLISIAAGLRLMRASFRRLTSEQRRFRDALVTERVADSAHNSMRALHHAIETTTATLRQSGETAAADRIAEAYTNRRAVADATISRWRRSANPGLAKAAEEGYLGGTARQAAPRSLTPLRRFATLESTPSWLPFAVRSRLAAGLRIVDMVRLLHDLEIERRALIATLYLRAGILALSPFGASGSFTGLVPLRGANQPLTTAIFIAALALAVLIAIRAKSQADTAIGQPTRWRRYGLEQVLAVAVIVAFPCWPVAVFSAVAVNWLERPDWTLRKLLVWLALTYIPLAVSAALGGASAAEIIAEVVTGLAVTALMAGSYGLMLPVTVVTLLGAVIWAFGWRIRASLAVRRDRTNLEKLIADAQSAIEEAPLTPSVARALLADLASARRRLVEPREVLRKRPRQLRRLIAHAVTDVVPPEDVDPEGLAAARVVVDPEDVGDLLIVSGRDAARLQRLVRSIVLEAADSGADGVLFTHLSVAADGRIRLEIANELPSARPTRGFGSGEDWLLRWVGALPDTELVRRKDVAGDHLHVAFRVHSVVVHIGRAVFLSADDADTHTGHRLR